MSDIYELQNLINADIFYSFCYKTSAKVLKYEKTFDMDWTMFKGGKPTTDALDQFHL